MMSASNGSYRTDIADGQQHDGRYFGPPATPLCLSASHADGLSVINDKFMTQSTSTEARHLARVGSAPPQRRLPRFQYCVAMSCFYRLDYVEAVVWHCRLPAKGTCKTHRSLTPECHLRTRRICSRSIDLLKIEIPTAFLARNPT